MPSLWQVIGGKVFKPEKKKLPIKTSEGFQTKTLFNYAATHPAEETLTGKIRQKQ
jgi:hypothetical protein